MSLEVKIPKEIKDYKMKPIGNFTIRQIISIVISVISTFLLYFILKLDSSIKGDLVIILNLPILAIGFIRPKQMDFEKYLIFKVNAIFENRTYLYKTYASKNQSNKRKSKKVNEVTFSITKDDMKKRKKELFKSCKNIKK